MSDRPLSVAGERQGAVSSTTWRDSPRQRRADIYVLVGSMLCGAIIFGPLGLPVLLYGVFQLRAASRAGEVMRPSLLYLVGLYVLVDAALNYVAWGVDLLPMHDTTLGLTWWSGMGHTLDGAYYIDYNTTSLGGTSFASEKALQISCVLLLFPMRIAGAWAFLKMRRWGHQVLVVTSWAYIFIWVVWISQLAMHWDERVATSLYGWFGYLVLNVFGFLGAFFTMPYLYSIDTTDWK